MAHIIIIETRSDKGFLGEAGAVLENNDYAEFSTNVFIGRKSPNSIVRDLKKLEVYKKTRSSAGINLHYGSLRKA